MLYIEPKYCIHKLNEILGEVDFPINNKKITSLMTNVQGWALTKNNNDLQILIFLDNNLIGDTKTGMPRIDIEKKLPMINNAYESGFNYQLELLNVKNGKHGIKVIAKNEMCEKLLGEIQFELNKNPKNSGEVLAAHKNFREHGNNFCNEFLIKWGKLSPYSRILDLGCSVGRVALPLTKFLNEKGSYEGLDIVPAAIKYAKKHISSKFSNFHFQVADIFNRNYNPGGTKIASEYIFPFNSEEFDFVCLFSVFTHMLPKDIENYLSEISRVLKPNGKCIISYFLLNDKTLNMERDSENFTPFIYEKSGYRTINEKVPEFAVAYEGDYIRKLYEKNGFSILEPIKFGRWRTNRTIVGGQDLIMSLKKVTSK